MDGKFVPAGFASRQPSAGGEIDQCELNLSTFKFLLKIVYFEQCEPNSSKCPSQSNISNLTSLLRVERHISHKTRQKSSAGGEII